MTVGTRARPPRRRSGAGRSAPRPTNPRTGSAPTLLVIADDRRWRRIRRALAAAYGAGVEIGRANGPDEAGERAAGGTVDALLLAVGRDEGATAAAVDRACRAAPDVPVIAVADADRAGTRADADAAVDALRAGAQDWLTEAEASGERLRRAVRHAIERHRGRARLREQAWIDELTGLYNRRGFLAVAGQQAEIAGRSGRPAAMVFADLDGLKRINDTLGHAAGDRALVETADLLRETFRSSDALGRLGGDEFGVLALTRTRTGARALRARLERRLRRRNAEATHDFPLSLSIGVALQPDARTASLAELLRRADRAMYRDKRARGARAAGERPWRGERDRRPAGGH